MTSSSTRPRRRLALRTGGLAWGPLRVQKGVSIRQLSAATGINMGTLSAMESGRVNPTEGEWARVMQALGNATPESSEGSTAPA